MEPDKAAADTQSNKVDPTATIYQMDQMAEELERSQAQKAPPPDGGGYMPADPQQMAQEKLAQEYAELCKAVLHTGFQVLCPNWQISEAESEALGDGYGAVLAKYFPEGPSQWGPEIGAGFATLAILAPRIGVPRKIDQDPRPEKNEKQEATQAEPEKPKRKEGDDVEVSMPDEMLGADL